MMEKSIHLNFLEITPIKFEFPVYRKRVELKSEVDEKYKVYIHEIYDSIEDKHLNYAYSFEPIIDFEEIIYSSDENIDITKEFLYYLLGSEIKRQKLSIINNPIYERRNRFYFLLKNHLQGIESVWLEPHYLEVQQKFGFLIDFKFIVNYQYKKKLSGSVDKKILELSGTLEKNGVQNKAFYLFKHEKIQAIISSIISKLEFLNINLSINSEFTPLKSSELEMKKYLLKNDKEVNSTFLGLKENEPFSTPQKPIKFYFIFKSSDKIYARNLFKALKGETYPQFSGMSKMFKISFENKDILSKELLDFNNDNDFLNIISEIKSQQDVCNIIPIILTNSNISSDDDRLYYRLKYLFISNDIPCQITTKNLMNAENSFKYSICNIALQIFAKAEGKPWKVKPANDKCLIIGIGSKHKIKYEKDLNGDYKKNIEKFQTYSVLTESSGLFKEIEILSESNEEEDYYNKLKNKMISIINQTSAEGNNNVVIHSPFKISKEKVWDKVFQEIPNNVNVTIVIINDKHKYFGFDLTKNSLIPYESSVIKIGNNEFLIWFEGSQYQNVNINKLIGAPVFIKLWHSNNPKNLEDKIIIKNILQDCINLSGANWRGFKAKQLPVSVFYCQTIAEFLKKFEEYGFNEIKIHNLKPWFL